MVNHIERCEEIMGENIIPEFQTVSILARIPGSVKLLASKIMILLGQKRLGHLTSLGVTQTTNSIL